MEVNRCTLRLEVLSSDEIDLVHDLSLEILKNTGVVMQDERILALFNEAGANVFKKDQLVKIPPYLVEESLKKGSEKRNTLQPR
ncbi:MAG: trimethylamine methyltransferase family protein [Candidatus Bathyarchaeia archaeon]